MLLSRSNDANWTTIAHVTDNQDAIVDQELENAAPGGSGLPPEGQHGLRRHALGRHPLPGAELYAASNAVRDYEGTFDTAKGGTFEVSFKKGLKNTLQTMQILVKPAGYVDVSSDAWYYEAVNYVTAKCLMIGTDANVFSPNMNPTRGQMVTILYRMANSPAVEGTAPFTDVAEGRYFADAVVWAYQNGIAKGMTDTAFLGQTATSPVSRWRLSCTALLRRTVWI